ncbi:23S rRNA (pseudouridine(1915)-N(3))-methyltransferase RlmH [bacterium]|nr:23S rRNA (pseudouridine(1915)-N(3))-methyltransferase RlmH [bacterium]
MNYHILAVGKLRDRSVAALCEEYARRLNRGGTSLVVEEVRQEQGASEAQRVIERESARLREHVPKGAFLVALDPTGEAVSSEELAARLERLGLEGRSRVAFLIGGALGLERSLVKEAGWVLSLSRMTFPHELARLILIEQLYRADSILRGEPYHK